MNSDQIKAIQVKIGTEPDGFWGPKSIAACQKHLRALMPVPHPWPSAGQSDLRAFYGSPGNESELFNLPVPDDVVMFYEGRSVRTIRCHRRVAASLARALRAAYAVAPDYVKIYDGCFNNRPMRGGSLPSLHARGAAIDLCAVSNGNHVAWPVAATMPFEVMECFAREGWLSAGAFWGRDAMHFQATL